MLIIRQATANDVDDIHRLGEHVAEFSTGEETVTFWPQEIVRAGVTHDSVMIYVAECKNQPRDRQIVGFILANCNQPLRKVLIENIYVQPDFRRQGIASALINAIRKQANENSYEFLSVLTPVDDEAAINAYQKSGFSLGERFIWLDSILADRFRK